MTVLHLKVYFKSNIGLHFYIIYILATLLGGCKHAIAFLMWIHRRSEEPTEIECYWKKSSLSSVGSKHKCITVEEFGAPPEKRLASSTLGSFLQAVIRQGKEKGSTMQLLKYYSQEEEWTQLSIIGSLFYGRWRKKCCRFNIIWK